MKQKKMTVVEQFTAIQSMLNGEEVENYTVEQAVEFLGERIAQTQRKNAGKDGEKKLTKTQQENEVTKETILAVLATAEKAMTIGDIQKSSTELVDLSNQKMTSLVSQLVKADKVARTEVKGKAHFALPSAEETAEE